MPRPPRLLVRLRPTILTGFLGLLGLTVGTIGVVAYVNTERALELLVEQHLDAVGRSTNSELQRLLDGAPRMLDELALLSQRGLLPDEPRDLGWVFVERMRQQPDLGWLGYADRAQRSFVGGTRSGEAGLRYYRATPEVNGGVPVERIVDTRGAWTEVAPDHPEPYDATTRDWFEEALDHPEVRWNEPYQFTDGAWGISVTRGVEQDGQVTGVLLADFFLADLTAYLAQLRVGETGRVLLVTSAGHVLGDADPDVHDALASDVTQGALQLHGEAHRLVRRPIGKVRGLDWDVAILVPERELTGVARENARRTVLLGLLALAAATLLAGWFATRISRDIRAMSLDLSRIRRLELSDEVPPASYLQEVAMMAEALASMKVGLRSFSRYVPVGLVRQLLEDGEEAQLGVTSRELSIVFSDIAGFTPLVESTPKETMVEALAAYLDRMNQAIDGSQGTVCQYLGDGILALWGAPVTQEDHALRACRGALAMRDVSKAMVADAGASGRPPMPTRIGVNSGEVLVGNIGATDRFNYAALGDPVNTASRIEGLNKAYGTSVLIGERTAELVGDAMVLRPVDRVRMKGKTEPLVVHELLGEAGRVDPVLLAAVERYENAFAAYVERRFDEALAGFEEVVVALGDDPPSQVLAERCRGYLAEPPPPDWDGAWTMATK